MNENDMSYNEAKAAMVKAEEAEFLVSAVPLKKETFVNNVQVIAASSSDGGGNSEGSGGDEGDLK